MDSIVSHAKPEPCFLGKGAIEEIAAKVASATGFLPGREIIPVVERLGGRVEFLDWDDWMEHEWDTIQVDGPRQFCIRLMGVDGPLRHRFTIAHELGHYVLHSQSGKKPLMAGRQGSDRVEWEANWFAAGLLMPERAFLEARRELGDNILALSGRFMVSREAAEVRIKSLGSRA